MKSSRRLGLTFAATIPLLSACSFFPESSFDLASDSQLPHWFQVPSTLTRSQVSVHLDYYLGRKATFTLLGPQHQVLSKVTGRVDGDEPKTLKMPPPGYPAGYPAYEVVSVNEVTDIIEHRKAEPISNISEDPAVWAELVPGKARRP